MSFFNDVDIKTVIFLLLVGNLVIFFLLIFYVNLREYRMRYWHFIFAKLFQSIAWLLLGLRGSVPVLVSAYIGDSVLFVGFALEAFSLSTAGRSEKLWLKIYTAMAIAGICIFCIFATTPNLWVGYATSISIAIFLPATVSMFLRPSSQLRRLIAGLYGICCIVLSVRAWSGFVSRAEFTLLSHNTVQTLSFVTMFLLLIVSGVGFLLILKESSYQKIEESEKKYRTLVESANEVICIIQDARVVFANQKMEGLLGVPRDKITGKPFADFVFPEDREMVVSHYTDRIGHRDAPESYNFRVVNNLGEPIWVVIAATLTEYGGKDAVIALMTNINRLKALESEKEKIIYELKEALAKVKVLSGFLPICAWCKKIRDDKGYWNQIETYLREHSEAEFSHSICPECMEKLKKDEVMGDG